MAKTKFDEIKEKFDEGKDYAKDAAEAAGEKGFNTFNVFTMIAFGILVFVATLILYGGS